MVLNNLSFNLPIALIPHPIKSGRSAIRAPKAPPTKAPINIPRGPPNGSPIPAPIKAHLPALPPTLVTSSGVAPVKNLVIPVKIPPFPPASILSINIFCNVAKAPPRTPPISAPVSAPRGPPTKNPIGIPIAAHLAAFPPILASSPGILPVIKEEIPPRTPPS